MTTLFYRFRQNNTGGFFDFDENVCMEMFIEAINKKHAIAIAEELGCYFDGVYDGKDCGCCGNRWYEPYGDNIVEIGKNDSIEEHAQHSANYSYEWTKPSCRIFYLSGKVVEVFKKEDKH